MVAGMAMAIKGSYKVMYQPLEGDEVELDFSPPWERLPMVDTIEKAEVAEEKRSVFRAPAPRAAAAR